MQLVHHTCPKIGLYRKSATRKIQGEWCFTAPIWGCLAENFWARLGTDWLSQWLSQSFLSDQQFLERMLVLSHSYWVHVYHLSLQMLCDSASAILAIITQLLLTPLAWFTKPQTWAHSILLICTHHTHTSLAKREKEVAGYRPLSSTNSNGPKTGKW